MKTATINGTSTTVNRKTSSDTEGVYSVENSEPLSFAAHIRPMFTETDIAHMKALSLDLSSRDDVAGSAEAIYTVVSDGSMPPRNSGEPRWTSAMCDLFKRWQQQGCPP
jgi:hypothetical protein